VADQEVVDVAARDPSRLDPEGAVAAVADRQRLR
jgi:hypothetical protein